jgi:hypothetical protein
MFTFTYDNFKNHINDLYALFKLGIQYENNSIKVSAIECLGSFINISEPKVSKKFIDLIPSILQTTYILLSQEDSQVTRF